MQPVTRQQIARRLKRCVLWFTLAATGLVHSSMTQAVQLRVDRVTLNNPVFVGTSFSRVTFRQPYSSPPAVFVLPTEDNPDPTHLRVVNVTTTGFDIQQFEPSGSDGLTLSTRISYIAATPGTHSLPSGELVEIGFTDISNHQGREVPGASWSTLSFANTFPDTVALLVELQTNNNGSLVPGNIAVPALTVVTRDIDTNSADIALEYSETSAGPITSTERVAYLAMAQNTNASFQDNTTATRNLRAIRSAENIFGWTDGCHTVNFGSSFSDPIAIAGKATRNGTDGGWIRRCALTNATIGLAIDEDQAEDLDRSHTSEIASVIVIDAPFDGPLGIGGWEADHANLTALTSNGSSLAFTSVVFPRSMSATPVVLTQPTASGGEPVAVRLRNVTANGFEVTAVRPPGTLSAPASMVLDYIAVVPGQHELRDGTAFEAGFVDSIQIQRATVVGGPEGTSSLVFNQAYTQPPTLLAHLQTLNNVPTGFDPAMPLAPWLTVAVTSVTSSGATVALERAEVAAGNVNVPERIGYLAFPSDRHATLVDIAGNTVAYDSRFAIDAVTGFDDGCNAVTYTAPFTNVPLAVGHGSSRNGNNGGWARRCGISSSALSQNFDEDTDNDSERAHTTEDISQLAFAQALEWMPPTAVSLTSSIEVVSDEFSTAQFKALPGAEVDLSVLATNTGAGAVDTTSTNMTFAVDPSTELFVGDLDGGGNSVVFTDGVAPEQSGLTWLPTQHISYSNDNATTFSYVPGAGLDFDPSVTHLRIAPAGTFAGASGGATPQFSVRYRIRIR